MAEINVERRRGPNPLIWILGLIVLAVVIWLVITMVRGEDPAGIIEDPPRIDTLPPQSFLLRGGEVSPLAPRA